MSPLLQFRNSYADQRGRQYASAHRSCILPTASPAAPFAPMNDLTHIDASGDVHMVNVGAKTVTERQATARAVVHLPTQCHQVLAAGGDTKKGNVFQVVRLAGIMAAKKTADLIPLCHQIPLHGVDMAVTLVDGDLEIQATARCSGRTGVEMEALTAASVAALTAYDMLKALSHDMVIGPVELLSKSGGKSGDIDRRQETQ